MSSDLTKTQLYESVKKIIETENKIVHLNQHKLYTLFSIAFQYMLFNSTKNPGSYIIRLEDGHLAEKLAKRSKDSTTRKFFSSLLIPRKLKFKKSLFYLDTFNVNSWNLTKDIPAEKLKGAIVVHNPNPNPFSDEDEELIENLGKDFHMTGLTQTDAKITVIGYEKDYSHFNAQQLEFPFIIREEEATLPGVTLSHSVNIETFK